MSDLSIATHDGGVTRLNARTLDALQAGMRGALIRPGDPSYDSARTVWNAMIDRRPGLIAQCAGTADVVRCVSLAAERGLLLAVRGGGHNVAGSGVCDGGLVIDLSTLRGVGVDPVARRARVGPGATLGDLDHETQAFALATPVGINSTTGLAGLTLGGGFGWLTRRYGLTVDNLISATVVLADGRVVTASEDQEPDLFWGLRGGGGNLGVVTSFELALHPVGPEVLSGLLVHPLDQARSVLQEVRKFVSEAPDDVACWAVLRKAPPLPFLPAEVHGTDVLILAAFHAGSIEEGERLLAPLRAVGRPIADAIAPHTYVGWQQAFDPLLAPGARNYWKSHNFHELQDELLEQVVDHAARLPSPQSEIFIGQLGGAAGRRPVDATAYPHRDARFVMNVHTRWEDAARDDACVAWARGFFEATAPFATGGVYVNFLSADEERVAAAYGSNYARLQQVKQRYDPGNVFRLNQNVDPGGR